MYTILGATGNVGSKIAETLISVKGEDIRLVSRSADQMLPCLLRRSRAELSIDNGDPQAFVGDIMDTDFLAQALTGADAAFTLIPPNRKAESFMAYAGQAGESIARAIETSGIKYVVNLSSIGTELPGGAGLVQALRAFEQRLNQLTGLNIVHIRAAFFMENLFMSIGQMRSKGINASSVRGDIKFPMVATQDVADAAVKLLLDRDFTGSSVRYVLGERDISMVEATAIIGEAIGKPGLSYVTVPYEEEDRALRTAGFSPDVSRLYVELNKALNEGRITGALTRTKDSTTAISFERFCREIFAQTYAQQKAA